MGKSTKVTNQIEASSNQVAASVDPLKAEELDELLDSYEEIEQTPDYVLRPNQLEPFFDFSALGKGRSNITCADLAKEIAGDMGVSPHFEALHTLYNRKNRSVLCIPKAKYVKKQPNLTKVEWAPDGTQMRVDLAALLAAENWKFSAGYEYRCQVSFVRNHPKVGSAMIIYLSEEGIKESRHRIREKNRAKNGTQGTPSKTATAKTNNATPNPSTGQNESKPAQSKEAEVKEPETQKPEVKSTAVNPQVTD